MCDHYDSYFSHKEEKKVKRTINTEIIKKSNTELYFEIYELKKKIKSLESKMKKYDF